MLEEDLEDFSLGDSEDENKELDEKGTEDVIDKNEKINKNLKDNSDDIINIESNINFTKKEDNVTSKIKSEEPKILNSEIDNNKISKYNDIIIFNGKEYHSFSRYNIYNSKRKIKKNNL